MSNPFVTTGLSQDQINSNTTLKYIDNLNTVTNNNYITLNDTINEKIYVNSTVGEYNTVTPNVNNTFAELNQSNLCIYGQNNLIQNNNTELLIIGNSNTAQFTDQNITIGYNNQNIHSVENIIIGKGTTANGADAINTCRNNIIIGNDSDLINGSRNNIIICNDANNGGDLQYVIQIGMCAIVGLPNPANGSIVFSSGQAGTGAPSLLPKLQFLNGGLTNLEGNAPGVAYNDAATFATPANINGYIRLKYKGKNIKIPVLADDDLNPAPNPV